MRLILGIVIGFLVLFLLSSFIGPMIAPFGIIPQWLNVVLLWTIRLLIFYALPSIIAGWIAERKGWLCGIILVLLDVASNSLVLYLMAITNYQQTHNPTIMQMGPIPIADWLIDNCIGGLKAGVCVTGGEIGVFLRLRSKKNKT